MCFITRKAPGRGSFDFEIVHEKSLLTKSRRVDDLLVFLLVLLALAPNRKWIILVLAFLNAYYNAPVIAQLKDQLAVPTGWHGFGGAFEQVRKSRQGKTASRKDRGRGR